MRFFIILTILCALSTSLHADEQIGFSMRKMWTLSPEHQKEIAILDSLYEHWHTLLIRDESTNYIPVDTLQFALGAAILDDFPTAHHPELLLALTEQYNVKVFLFLYPVFGRDLQIEVKALSFPSGSFLARDVINVDKQNVLQSSLEKVLQHIRDMRTACGFPFHHREKGVLFSSSENYSDKTNFWNGAYAAQKMADPDDSTTCRFKSINVTRPVNPDSLLSYLNGNVFVRGTKGDTSRVLFAYPFSDTGFGELPFWPDLETIREYTLSVDSAYVVHLCTALHPDNNRLNKLQQTISLGMNPYTSSLAWQTAVMLHNNASEQKLDSLKADVLHAAYQQLTTFFTDQLSRGWTRLNYAEFCMNQGDVEKALNLFKSAEDAFASLGEDRPFFLAARSSGEIYEKLEKWQEAEQAYRRAVEVSDALQKNSLSADLYKHIGMAVEKQNAFLRAWSFYELSKDAFLACNDSLNAARMFGEMGRIMRETGQLKRSSEYLTSFVNFAENSGHAKELAKAYYSQAQTTREMGHTEQALESLWNAGDAMELLGDTTGLADVEEQLGQLYVNMGQNKEAEARFYSALNLYESQADTSGMVRCLVWLGRIAASQDLPQSARQFYFRAENYLDTSATVSDDLRAQLYYHRALLYQDEGLYLQALEDLQRLDKLEPIVKEKVVELRKELRQQLGKTEEP